MNSSTVLGKSSRPAQIEKAFVETKAQRIPSLLDKLSNSIGTLHNAMDDLEAKMQPVLAFQPPTPQEAKSEGGPPPGKVADWLETEYTRINALIERVTDITARAEC